MTKPPQPTELEPVEGWGWPTGARKMHYFRSQMALCGRYGFYRGPLTEKDRSFPKSINHCATCNRLKGGAS